MNLAVKAIFKIRFLDSQPNFPEPGYRFSTPMFYQFLPNGIPMDSSGFRRLFPFSIIPGKESQKMVSVKVLGEEATLPETVQGLDVGSYGKGLTFRT